LKFRHQMGSKWDSRESRSPKRRRKNWAGSPQGTIPTRRKERLAQSKKSLECQYPSSEKTSRKGKPPKKSPNRPFGGRSPAKGKETAKTAGSVETEQLIKVGGGTERHQGVQIKNRTPGEKSKSARENKAPGRNGKLWLVVKKRCRTDDRFQDRKSFFKGKGGHELQKLGGVLWTKNVLAEVSCHKKDGESPGRQKKKQKDRGSIH